VKTNSSNNLCVKNKIEMLVILESISNIINVIEISKMSLLFQDLLVLPQYIINIIYQYNSDHRTMLSSSLTQIKQQCICASCEKHCELEVCLIPNAKMFCGQTCMDFWMSMSNDMRYFHEDDESDFMLEDEAALMDYEFEQYLYEYLPSKN